MPVLGAIADDFTGATDLANNLVREGMRAVQVIGVPGAGFEPGAADAVIVALKSRTAPVAEAVADSRAALAWLRQLGCQRFFFKYCSTFDSTDAGNIGPVADALLADLGADFAVAAPAFPENARTVYQGYLFANGVLLNESGMQDHPLTPMTDPNLVRVLGRQTDARVGLIDYATLEGGPGAVRAGVESLRADGHRYAIADSLDDTHLQTLAAALAEHPLITGGSGIALGLPACYRRAGLLAQHADAADLGEFGGTTAVVSGSCSRRTLAQVARMSAERPAFALAPEALAAGEDVVAEALAWAEGHLATGPVLIYASAEPERVRAAQDALGVERAGALVEEALAAISQGLVTRGVHRLVVAGGETAGAVVGALGIQALRIGPQIDPGVPWTAALGGEAPLALALKSGNFGAEDFFLRAFEVQP